VLDACAVRMRCAAMLASLYCCAPGAQRKGGEAVNLTACILGAGRRPDPRDIRPELPAVAVQDDLAAGVHVELAALAWLRCADIERIDDLRVTVVVNADQVNLVSWHVCLAATDSPILLAGMV
jgi:hypothetical protein